jgi:CHAT domain-containing protein
LLSGPRADRRRILSHLSRVAPAILHFACHGTFVAADPDASCIALAGASSAFGRDLTALEVAGLSIDGTLVVLSACSSGVKVLRTGDEPFGLVRGFLVAGARAVATAAWPVADVSTWLLMERFAHLLVGGVPAAAALGRAQRHLREMTATEMVDACTRARRGEVSRLDRDIIALADRRLRLRGHNEATEEPGEWLPFAHPVYWAGFSLAGDWT